MGIALSRLAVSICDARNERHGIGLTLVKDVRYWTIVQNDDLAQIRLDAAQVLDVRAVAKGAVLPVEATSEVLLLLLQPINNWVGILLDGSCEDDYFVPLADFLQELVAVRSLVYVV